MASFKADHVSIAEFGRLVGGLTTDSTAAVTYVGRWLDIGYAEGRMFASVVEKATEVREALRSNYQKLETVVSSSSDEITKTARLYRETDRAEAERLDRTYD
ncbi:MAG: type VII secretion target [Pseudonocardiales bacterium]